MLAGCVSSFKPQEKHTQKNMLIHTRILGGSGFWSIYIAIVVVLGEEGGKQTNNTTPKHCTSPEYMEAIYTLNEDPPKQAYHINSEQSKADQTTSRSHPQFFTFLTAKLPTPAAWYQQQSSTYPPSAP
jgi:hypothetical protein